MKKRICIILLLGLFLLGCSTDSNTETNKLEEKKEDTIQVTNARKTSYANTLKFYADFVKLKVNEGLDYKIFDTEILVFIPIGIESYGCALLETGGKSPFNDTWKYAYIGVHYNEVGYEYFVVAQDGANYGIDLVEINELNASLITENHTGIEELANKYTGKIEEKNSSVETLPASLKSIVKSKLPNVTKVTFVSASKCSYK